MKWKSFYSRLFDLIVPRCCLACGCRLDVGEACLCVRCNTWLPRTGYATHPYDNPMTQLFYVRTNVERCAALFFYQPHSASGRLIYQLKYYGKANVAEELGRMTANEMLSQGFFEGIDGLLPVPLGRKREQERGYNQSMEIARGVAGATGLPVFQNVVRRSRETPSQTTMHHNERVDNVTGAFTLLNAAAVKGRHVLIIDDVVTTGSTVSALAQELQKAENVRISVLSLGFTHL